MNKYHAEPGLQHGMNPGQKVKAKGQGPLAPTPSLPMGTASWQGVPGKTQKSRNNGIPQAGPLGQFTSKRIGL